MLKIENYNSNILKAITFELKEREHLIILGSNGAGKSTLAKVLCGITHANNLFIHNKKLNSLSSEERIKAINYIPPKLEIFDEYLTLQEYLQLSQLFSTKKPKDILELLKIEHLKDKPCRELSSGEQQLTMIGTAILHNAKITILDEPTANLDPQKSRDIYHLLKSEMLQSKIIITHDLNLAYHLGYNICYMDKGKISFLGSNQKFFQESNLHKFFGTSIAMVEEYVVMKL